MSINTVDGVARESARNPHEDPAQGIHRAASALRKCARNGHPARSKAVVLLCVDLLDAAIRWRDNAIAEQVAAGQPLRARPRIIDSLRYIPRGPQQPAHRKYAGRLLMWASRYAWDVAEGRDGEEAITGLLGTAAIGSQSSPEPTPKAFYDGILTLARPLARR